MAKKEEQQVLNVEETKAAVNSLLADEDTVLFQRVEQGRLNLVAAVKLKESLPQKYQEEMEE